jgi:hypothetical protein
LSQLGQLAARWKLTAIGEESERLQQILAGFLRLRWWLGIKPPRATLWLVCMPHSIRSRNLCMCRLGGWIYLGGLTKSSVRRD